MSTARRSIIALLTDFGTRDYFVASMKGVILSTNPDATLVDITHEIAPQDIREASFILRACYRDFPRGTIFVAVVDPGVGSNRRAIAAAAEGYYFIAPDNGLLSFVLQGQAAYEITNRDIMAPIVSRTFHGRDIFAPAAAHLSLGRELAEFGPRIGDPVAASRPEPTISSDGITGEIIHIDRFGNLVTNLTIDLLPKAFKLEISGKTIQTLRNTYSEAADGELFLIEGSAGLAEICIRGASAAHLLGISTGERIFVTKYAAQV